MYIHSNVEVAGEAEVQLADEQEKYDARVLSYKASMQSTIILIFDEVKIAAKLHWNSRNDALVGHSMLAREMSTLCDLYTNLEKRETPANTDYVKQTLWRDMTSDCDIVGPYYTSSGPFKAKTMLPCVLDALRKFHCHGFDVCALVCDGASSNLTMIKTLLGKKGHFAVQKDLPDPHEVQAHFKNPFSGGKIHIMICPSHQVC